MFEKRKQKKAEAALKDLEDLAGGVARLRRHFKGAQDLEDPAERAVFLSDLSFKAGYMRDHAVILDKLKTQKDKLSKELTAIKRDSLHEARATIRNDIEGVVKSSWCQAVFNSPQLRMDFMEALEAHPEAAVAAEAVQEAPLKPAAPRRRKAPDYSDIINIGNYAPQKKGP